MSAADVELAARRVLEARFRLGIFDPPEQSPWAGLGAKDLGTREHLDLAREVAARGAQRICTAGSTCRCHGALTQASSACQNMARRLSAGSWCARADSSARAGSVLLKNDKRADGQPALPLDDSRLRKVRCGCCLPSLSPA